LPENHPRFLKTQKNNGFQGGMASETCKWRG
jgi:hypothetical protein